MPELPDVEAARQALALTVVGKRLVRASAPDDRIVFQGVTAAAFCRSVEGRRVVAAHRRGKHLWLELDARPWPVFHFGMTGELHFLSPEAPSPAHCKMDLFFEDGTRVAMRDPRRFGRIRLQHDPECERPIRALGFDPILDLPSEAEFTALIKRRKSNLKAVLLNQAFSAGVGNWIADEVLYQSRLSPKRRSHRLSDEEARRLRRSLKQICEKAVAVGANAERFPREWLFHVRWSSKNKQTRRGERIVRQTIAGRTTAWVPSLQK